MKEIDLLRLRFFRVINRLWSFFFFWICSNHLPPHSLSSKAIPLESRKMPQVKIIAKNFMDMVASLTAIKLDKLYNNVFICEAILRFSFVAHQFVKSFVRCHLLGCGRIRSLPPLAKKYVLQLLFIDDPVPCTRIEEWVLPDGLSKHRVAIDRLIQLRIFTETVVDRYAFLLVSFIIIWNLKWSFITS